MKMPDDAPLPRDGSASADPSARILPPLPPEQLLHAIREAIRSLEKADKAKENIVSGLNVMLRHGVLDAERLHEQLGSGFARTLAECRTAICADGAKRHWLSWPSYLRDIRRAYDDVATIDITQMSFGDALYTLCTRQWRGVSRSQASKYLSAATGISLTTIKKWMKCLGKPSAKSIDHVRKIDAFFDADGALSKKVRLGHVRVERPRTPSDVLGPLPAEAAEAFADYATYFLEGALPGRRTRRFLSELSVHERRMYAMPLGAKAWTRDANGLEATKQRLHSVLRKFFHFCAQKKYVPPDELCVHHVFDMTFLVEYFEFAANEGADASTEKFYMWLAREARPNSYMSQYHAPPGISWDEWKIQVEEIRQTAQHYAQQCKQLRERVDAKRHIQWILDADDPWMIIRAITKTLRAQIARTMLSDQYLAARNHMMWVILTATMLRIKNVAGMQWCGPLEDSGIAELRRTKACGLYWDQCTHRYVVYVDKAHLKNRKNPRVSSLIRELPGSMKDDIYEYILSRRAHLERIGKDSAALFPYAKVEEGGENVGIGRKAAGMAIADATRMALSELYPDGNPRHINAHAIRHLMASLYLREHPEDYVTLASLLMDDLQTVIKQYAQRDERGASERITMWLAGHL